MHKKSMRVVVASLVAAALVVISSSFLASANSDPAVQRQALIEIARAYYRQGGQIQYDYLRKNHWSTPEDATGQHSIYTACAAFTFAAYYHTLGIEIPSTTRELMNYAKANRASSSTVLELREGADVIYSSAVLGTADSPNYVAYSQYLANKALPGDVLVIRRENGTGHAMLIESVDTVNKKVQLMESVGVNYDYEDPVRDRIEPNGSIRTADLADKLESYHSAADATDLTLLRFITDGTNYIKADNTPATYTMTLSAQSRLNYPSINIEKTAAVTSQGFTSNHPLMIDLGDLITYTIKIKNSSTTNYPSFNIVENFDSRFSLTNDGGASSTTNSSLTWTVNGLEAGQEITRSYTVKVPANNSLKGKVITSTGKVDNIATSRIEHFVGTRLTEAEKASLTNTFNNLKTNSSTERNFINQVYSEALGINMGLNNNLQNLDIIGYNDTIPYGGGDTVSVKKTEVKALANYIYHNHYGLRLSLYDNSTNQTVQAYGHWRYDPLSGRDYLNEITDRARAISRNRLETGDVVLTQNGGAYFFINNQLHRKTGANQFETLSDATDIRIFLRNLVGDNYIILRPALSITRQTPTQPTAVNAAPGDGQAVLSWTASGNGSSAATGYIIQYKTSAASSWTTFSDNTSTATTITITGLTNGITYNFRVAAKNSVGTSVYSDTATTIPRTVPSAPSTPNATANAVGQINLSWTAPNNGGSAIIGYIIQYRTSPSGTWTTFSDNTSTATTITVTGLTNGIAYDFQVAAKNIAGTGAYSDIATIIPEDPTTLYTDKAEVEQQQPLTVTIDNIDPIYEGKVVEFWLNSDPIKLGEGVVQYGTATVTALIPCGVPAGEHTVTAVIDGVTLPQAVRVKVLQSASCPAAPGTGVGPNKPLKWSIISLLAISLGVSGLWVSSRRRKHY